MNVLSMSFAHINWYKSDVLWAKDLQIKTKAKRGSVTCLTSHSDKKAELKLEPRTSVIWLLRPKQPCALLVKGKSGFLKRKSSAPGKGDQRKRKAVLVKVLFRGNSVVWAWCKVHGKEGA